MQVKKSSNTKTYLFITLSLLFLLVFGLFINGNTSKTKAVVESTSTKQNDATKIPTTTISIPELIETERSYIYKNEELFIFAIQEGLIPKLVYAYKTPLSTRANEDLFFIHIYLKNKEAITTPYYNITFEKPEESQTTTVNGIEYILFTKPLLASTFKNGVVSFEEMDYMNLGRFDRTQGRSLDAKNLKIDTIQIEKEIPKIVLPENASNIEVLPLKTLNAYAKESNFEKIRAKRDDAIDKQILISEDDDYIKGAIEIEDGEKLNADFRLKGDWTDHLNGENQWSYRFVLKNQKTLLGMRKFSIQHPKTRSYQWEWLFNKVVKDEGIIGLRYDFIYFNQYIENNSVVELIDNKVMAIEESFDKILIENNKKREGVIIAFDESMVWEDRQYGRSLGLDDYPFIGNRALQENAKIKVYNENKVLLNPALKKQFLVAKDLLEGLRLGKYSVSEVFDIDKLTMYVALCNVFGGQHGLAWHNLRIYYNPITNKLEPISFDSQGGYKISALRHYPFAESDPVYVTKLAEKLKLVSSQEYITNITSKYALQINQLTDILYEVYPKYIFEIKTLEYNSNVIKKLIFPINLVKADVVSYSKNKLLVEIENLNNFPVSLTKLLHLDGKTLNKGNSLNVNLKSNETKTVTISLKNAFNNAFVSKKNKKGGFVFPNDVAKLRVAGVIDGVEFLYVDEIGTTATNINLDDDIALYRNTHSINYTNFPFVKIVSDSSQIIFKKGNYVLSKNIKIPAGLHVNIESGFNLDFTNNASLISKSPLLAKGTKNNLIKFTSKDGTGGGLFIDRAQTTSTLAYCEFDNLSNPHNEIWSVSGAINFNESEVSISNCTFKNNRCEDGLNVIRSHFTMTDSEFHNTFSDSFDGDFVTGTIDNCKFYNAGNDAIDVSGSQLTLTNITIENPLDKGISAGEASEIEGSAIRVKDGEIGIVSKDLSTVTLEDVLIENTRLGFSAFQKKSEYGKAEISITELTQIKNETKYLIENGCKLTIENVVMPTVSNNVIEQMYGVEYGKSSK